MKIAILLLLPFVFALLNRGRGSNAGIFGVKIVPFLCKVTASAVIGGMLWYHVNHLGGGWLAGKAIPWWLLWSFGLSYWLGECSGWGKWQGGLLNYNYWPAKNADGRLARDLALSGPDILWIGALANKLGFSPVDSPYSHCVAALSIRGLYWWVLPVGILIGAGAVTPWVGAAGLVIVSVAFPLSVEWAASLDMPPFLVFEGASPTDKWAAHSELIYGFIQGAALAGMMI